MAPASTGTRVHRAAIRATPTRVRKTDLFTITHASRAVHPHARRENPFLENACHANIRSSPTRVGKT